MPCARQNYVDNYVTEDKDRERILSSGPRECENSKDLTKRAKISSSPCKCGCARLLRPPKPVMRIDYAKQAAVKLAQQRKQVLEYTVERVRAEILQNDDEGAAYFWNVHSGTTLQSHIQRVRLYYNEHYNSLCVTCIHTSIHTSGFRIANRTSNSTGCTGKALSSMQIRVRPHGAISTHAVRYLLLGCTWSNRARRPTAVQLRGVPVARQGDLCSLLAGLCPCGPQRGLNTFQQILFINLV